MRALKGRAPEGILQGWQKCDSKKTKTTQRRPSYAIKARQDSTQANQTGVEVSWVGGGGEGGLNGAASVCPLFLRAWKRSWRAHLETSLLWRGRGRGRGVLTGSRSLQEQK